MHYLMIGKAQGLPAFPSPEERLTEGQANTLFRREVTALVPLYARRPLDFICHGTSPLSVVLVLHNRFAPTLQALARCAGTTRGIWS